VVRILAPEGTHVEAGEGVMIVEAMKMQNEVKAPKSGVVARILAQEGAAVNAGDPLAIVE
jgi:biotin carboxyl carrier protein